MARMYVYSAILLSFVAGLIHLWVMPEHWQEWWGYGVFFLVTAIVQVSFSATLLGRLRHSHIWLGIGGNILIVGLYVVSRTTGVPFVGPHAGHAEPVGLLDMSATLAELTLIVALGMLQRHSKLFMRKQTGTRSVLQNPMPVHPALVAAFAVALAYGGGFWSHLIQTDHSLIHTEHNWIQDATYMLPLTVVLVWFAMILARWLWQHSSQPRSVPVYTVQIASIAFCSSILLSSVHAVHQLLAEAGQTPSVLLFLCSVSGTTQGSWLLASTSAMQSGAISLTANLVITTAVALAFFGLMWVKGEMKWWLRPQVAVLTLRRVTVALTMAALVSGSFISVPTLAPTAAAAAPTRCEAGNVNRTYDVAAINVTIPYNRWGDLDRDGMVYVLQGDKDAVKNWHVPLSETTQKRRLRPRPLVLRANAGECVKVTLTNELNERQWGGRLTNPRVAMHIQGPSYSAQTSDGSAVGFNQDTTVGGGESITYYWLAPEEGLYYFRDHGMSAGSEADGGSAVHGLFGALAVEPAGSQWLDPVSGAPLYTGTTTQSGDLYIDAVIKPASGAAFRESIQLGQDEIPGIGFGFNYGAEPGEHRVAHRCPDCISEETALSSWAYGDPALVKLASGLGPWLPAKAGDTNVPDPEDCGLQDSCYVANVHHAYPKDPTKIRFGMGGVKETHVFHMHAHQWRVEPKDDKSTIIDSQTFGPAEMFTADLIGGAGSNPGTIGDSIFHCHLYPHFTEGMWSLFRVHDVREDGSTRTPDGIKVRALQPLPGKATPPAPTTENPGFPRFIPGEFGWRPPQAPTNAFNPDGTPATRIVAGKTLDPAKVAVEQNVAKGTAPGAPYIDPCPANARQVTYNITVLQREVVYNEAGWRDTQARIYVLDNDVDAILAGTKEPEPLFIRVNAGDCINFNLTNMMPNWYGNDAFVELGQANMVGGHVHLVKFDVLGSDGSTNGWNYNGAAFSKEQMDFNAAVLAGEKQCTTDEAQGACRIPMNTAYDPSTKSTRAMQGQTIKERWYADTELRTVFSHDHHFPAAYQNKGLFSAMIVEPAGMNFRNPFTGEFYQPGSGNVPGAPSCGNACEGTAAGAMMDVIGPASNDDFREYGVAIQDFVSLTKAGGNPQTPADTFNPPAHPEEYPNEDPGIMGINYRNAPFVLRDTKNGQPVDPAYRFSSTVFGDPKTPLLQAYGGDRVRFRLVQGSQEEQHVFMVHGMRWRQEPVDPNSPLVNSQAIGISEAFNFEIPKVECGLDEDCRGDYLYSSSSTDATYLGAWGLMRVYWKGVPQLKPLPDNTPQAANGNTNLNVTGSPPPKANKPGTPCPANAPVRQYNVVALDASMQYNEAGDKDPYGLMYALAEDEAAIRDGTKKPEPLVLRANEGDCIEVSLTNKLTQNFLKHGGAADGDPRLPLEPPSGTRAGLRVSLHPQLVLYDVRGSDGATVGFNRDQTVGPGESILYRWFADDVAPGEIGTTNLLDYGDVRGHRHHGLFAGLNIEPKGATYHDPITGAEIRSGVAADIRAPGMPDFREFTLFFQDGLNLRDKGGAIIKDPGTEGDFDPEDQGEKGFNYTNAPFKHRLGRIPSDATSGSPLDGNALANVFSSKAHGDPATPIFRAYAGDPVRMRVLQGGDKPRQHAFQVSGHAWRVQPHDPNSTLIGLHGGISVGRTVNMHLPSAGSLGAYPGDYRYTSQVAFHHQSGGLWGIMRVYQAPSTSGMFTPDALGTGKDTATGDNPHRDNYRPIMPLDQATVNVSVFRDSNADLKRGQGEGPIPNVNVTLKTSAGTVVGTKPTGEDGRVSFAVAQGAYDVAVSEPADFAATTPKTFRIDASEANTSALAEFGMVQLADVAIRVYDDKNGNNALDAGEGGLAGWTVQLSGGGQTPTATTDANGFARFDNLKPGSYTADASAQAGWFGTRKTPVAVEVAENASLQDPNDVRIGYTRKAGLSVKLFNDSNGNGAQDAGERNLAGWGVTASGGSSDTELAAVTVTAVTNADGVAVFDDPDPAIDGLRAGSYTLTQKLQPDWSCASAKVTVDGTPVALPAVCDGGVYATVLVKETTQVVTMGNRNPNAWIVAAPFNDLNNNGTQDGKESKLIGWTVNVLKTDGTPAVPAATVGNGGQAVVYPIAPGTYDVQFVPPPPSDPNEPGWTATPGGSNDRMRITVTAGEVGTARKGFVQLGAITALLFNDLDKDGIWDDDEGILPNRNVRLWDSTGKTLIAQGYTDADGNYAFKASAGVKYQLEALVPTGWTASTTAKGTVTGPSSTTGVEQWYGQYGNVDTTPPPAPAATPKGGTYSSAQSVALTSETGATIRYTVDGTDPTATRGTMYTGPVRIEKSLTLKAVAMDASNNVSPMTTELYTINATTAPQTKTVAANKVTMTTGTVASGTASNLAANDQSYLTLNSALPKGSKTHTSNWYGSATLPTGERNLTGLTIDYDGGASATGFNRTVFLYNFATGAWETLETKAQTTADVATKITVNGDAKRFVSSTGELRVRVQAGHTASFQVKADHMAFTYTYQP